MVGSGVQVTWRHAVLAGGRWISGGRKGKAKPLSHVLNFRLVLVTSGSLESLRVPKADVVVVVVVGVGENSRPCGVKSVTRVKLLRRVGGGAFVKLLCWGKVSSLFRKIEGKAVALVSMETALWGSVAMTAVLPSVDDRVVCLGGAGQKVGACTLRGDGGVAADRGEGVESSGAVELGGVVRLRCSVSTPGPGWWVAGGSLPSWREADSAGPLSPGCLV